jgi:hypothetical protein
MRTFLSAEAAISKVRNVGASLIVVAARGAGGVEEVVRQTGEILFNQRVDGYIYFALMMLKRYANFKITFR